MLAPRTDDYVMLKGERPQLAHLERFDRSTGTWRASVWLEREQRWSADRVTVAHGDVDRILPHFVPAVSAPRRLRVPA